MNFFEDGGQREQNIAGLVFGECPAMDKLFKREGVYGFGHHVEVLGILEGKVHLYDIVVLALGQ